MSRNTKAVRGAAVIGAILAYVGAVAFGDIMFITVIGVAFPKSGIFAALAFAGALVTALSALTLPVALHWWFSPGGQFIWGIVFWGADIVALSLNSILAFQVASGGTIDPFIEMWRSWSPATPMLAVIGWGIVFLFDQSHKLRHASAELEADNIERYQKKLKSAGASDEVDTMIEEAAKAAAADMAQRLSSVSIPKPKSKSNLLGGNAQPQMIPLNSEGDNSKPETDPKAKG